MTGKVGTDIQDNKCSWLVVQALQRVTMEQRLILEVTNSAKWSLLYGNVLTNCRQIMAITIKRVSLV